jgi:hypothetical protein
MTDGERLVWAASFALSFDRGGDSVAAVRVATIAITELRAVAVRRTTSGGYVIAQIDERDFVDEIVSAP